MIILVILVIAVGGLVQIVPLFNTQLTVKPLPTYKPYNALQLAGRNIYIREGCHYCHTQMVRPFRAETERYGHYSVAGEQIYERPFLWGSKRTGPDLARMSEKNYGDEWHRLHLLDPRKQVKSSVMPAYPWLEKNKVNIKLTQKSMRVLKMLGHPYKDEEIRKAATDLKGKTEMDAVIAYLQSLGKALTREDLRKTISKDDNKTAKGK
jgi:cytochrome c oxidase cbb3-type subunit 2